ncbi:hydrolase [Fictibacillus nanhaiensis]|uniref:alanyl-tRNA editing protein n=1 Tax=Fictibacillus nanhaiensis TaxID=742169 RepID=UPI001C95C59F|nr:alanyl-tRNA editing protein [Fictibacillus nanhaiensis]MBY6035814.1 hydrolase [Fictibacillus nanhaiensis]
MTQKIYYHLPYTTDWGTNIKKAIEHEKNYFVILEDTAFYPTGGGQPCDTGTIDGIEVLDVFIENNEVVHKLKRLPESTNVQCKLNWSRRFDHMQHHSGQHLLSAVCYSLYQVRTVNFHLGAEDVTIDVETSDLTRAQIERIEQEVNNEIYKNRKIHQYFVTNQELKNIDLLKMPKVTENIRIVEIEGIEHNACGGTHVSRTGEIGLIKVFKTEKQKGLIRIYFKCGSRALQELNESLSILNHISAKFNTSRREVLHRIEKWEQEQWELETRLNVLKEKNFTFLANEMLAQTKDDNLFHIFDDISFHDMKDLAIKLANENSLFILFATTSENKIVLAHNETKSIACGKFLTEHLSSFNGKGGGNDKTAQAGFPSTDDMLAFFKFACTKLVDV